MSKRHLRRNPFAVRETDLLVVDRVWQPRVRLLTYTQWRTVENDDYGVENERGPEREREREKKRQFAAHNDSFEVYRPRWRRRRRRRRGIITTQNGPAGSGSGRAPDRQRWWRRRLRSGSISSNWQRSAPPEQACPHGGSIQSVRGVGTHSLSRHTRGEHGQRKIAQGVPAGRLAVSHQSRRDREYRLNRTTTTSRPFSKKKTTAVSNGLSIRRCNANVTGDLNARLCVFRCRKSTELRFPKRATRLGSPRIPRPVLKRFFACFFSVQIRLYHRRRQNKHRKQILPKNRHDPRIYS